ncbi:hypothetical protein ACIP6V_07125 [Streptomyces sp. NPDC088770]|uniref:hypothetical protein n=1 Tax=unclassified Streptomyces TaxID=2593676 RepID=UPI002DD8A93A|nr:hypothetical protein [Streptomyces sp. NBC_01788]WSB25142.1 hypothetical protein OIE49_04125 [Streptomyces sp. NBC_01788]
MGAAAGRAMSGPGLLSPFRDEFKADARALCESTRGATRKGVAELDILLQGVAAPRP